MLVLEICSNQFSIIAAISEPITLMNHISSTQDLLEACWKYLVLGLVQGLTEFLPISSTAHLKVVPMILGWGDPGVAIAAVIQLGSILAVITYFRKDLKDLLKGITLAFLKGQWREKNARLGIAICIGTIPILLGGMLIKLWWTNFEDSQFRGIPSIALISILMALILAIAEKKGSQSKLIKEISGKDGLYIGFSQLFALIPGVSRSGITLSAGLLYGWKREEAARFSFLLGIPAITSAGLAELRNAFHSDFNLIYGGLPLILGIASAAVMSWISIDWLLGYLQKNNTWIFVIYRLVFGTALLSWWLGNTTSP